jgi:hypothetical protein
MKCRLSQVAGDGGFETTRFRGYDQLFVVGGDGRGTDRHARPDSATTLTSAQPRRQHGRLPESRRGERRFERHARVRSTSQTSVFAGADGGDDLSAFDAPTVNNLLANVTVSGGPLAGPSATTR